MAKKGEKTRIDRLLAARGFCPSRQKAKAVIMAGQVEVDGVKIDKPGTLISSASSVKLMQKDLPYVSRGGIKLKEALDYFSVDVTGLTVMDIGASTGGFSDCLLKRGAAKIIAIDVGYGQLDWSLRCDPRVEVRERTNARYLKPDEFNEVIHGSVIDVSFISLRLIVPAVMRLLRENSFIIALIKPQFEVGRDQVGKGGVVRSSMLHQEVIESLEQFFKDIGLTPSGVIPSPILGPKGNKEFLTHLRL